MLEKNVANRLNCNKNEWIYITEDEHRIPIINQFFGHIMHLDNITKVVVQGKSFGNQKEDHQ